MLQKRCFWCFRYNQHALIYLIFSKQIFANNLLVFEARLMVFNNFWGYPENWTHENRTHRRLNAMKIKRTKILLHRNWTLKKRNIVKTSRSFSDISETFRMFEKRLECFRRTWSASGQFETLYDLGCFRSILDDSAMTQKQLLRILWDVLNIFRCYSNIFVTFTHFLVPLKYFSCLCNDFSVSAAFFFWRCQNIF